MSNAVGYQRLHALSAAHRRISADLSLPAMLDRIVAAACELVGARCGALGVLTSSGSYERFVHHAMDPALAQRVARGAPAPLTDPSAAPQLVSISDPSCETRAAARLPGGGPVPRFLCLPIPVRGEVFGMLFVAEPADTVFCADDEELLVAFAAGAGTALENARLYEDARRSRDWLNAAGEIARVLLAGADENTLFEVVSRALYVAEADYGSLILPTADGKLEVALVVGLGAGDWRGHVFDPANSEVGRAIANGESRIIPELTELAAPGYQNVHEYGPAMLAPLVDAEGIRGAVMLIRSIGRPQFTAHELELAATFADQVALAFQLHEVRADAESLRALEDRHRIAEELHDNVMQRLFAIGVGLEGLALGPLPAETVARLENHVTDLDETINEIRERVFGLRSTPAAQPFGTHHRFPRIPPPDDPDRQTRTT